MNYFIVDIKLDSDHHKQIIMRLCERNDFYIDDAYYHLYKKTKPETRTMLEKTIPLKFLEEMEAKMPKGFFDRTGRFICVKNKVCGFMIIGHSMYLSVSEILFLLVDKKYQDKGFGKAFVNEAKIICRNEHTIRVKVAQENINYYKKFGFIDYVKLENNNTYMKFENSLRTKDVAKMNKNNLDRYMNLIQNMQLQ